MNTSLHRPVRLGNPEQVVAAVPHLLGFYPHESLVFTTLHGRSSESKLGMTARVDLPGPGDLERTATALIDGAIESVGPDAVLIVVVGGQSSEVDFGSPAGGGDVVLEADHEQDANVGSHETEPPFTELIRMIESRLSSKGIQLARALWTPRIEKGARWCSYDDDAGGTVPDPGISPVAAAMAVSGSVTRPSRQQLAELVACESPEAARRLSARLTLLQDEAELRRNSGDHCTEDTRIVFDAIRRTAREAALTEDDQLWVLIALSDFRVRDRAMATALTGWAAAAEQLWLSMVRRAPEPEVADVAALLAFSAYLRGDGALAAVALERIEKVRPAHRLGLLLRKALDTGLSPERLAAIVRDTAEDARVMIAEEES